MTVEAALGQKLVLPGQAPPTEEVPPRSPTPPPRIPATAWAFPGASAAADLLKEVQWVYRALEWRRKTFQVQLGDQVDSISIDRIKPHLGEGNPAAARPPRRGRQPRSADQT